MTIALNHNAQYFRIVLLKPITSKMFDDLLRLVAVDKCWTVSFTHNKTADKVNSLSPLNDNC